MVERDVSAKANCCNQESLLQQVCVVSKGIEKRTLLIMHCKPNLLHVKFEMFRQRQFERPPRPEKLTGKVVSHDVRTNGIHREMKSYGFFYKQLESRPPHLKDKESLSIQSHSRKIKE